MKHLLSLADLSAAEIIKILGAAQTLKQELVEQGRHQTKLAHKTLIMVFEKPSLRTRLSFEIGMTQLGGHAVYLAPGDIGLGTRESVKDVAAVASRLGDCLMARVCAHATVVELAEHSAVPVINGLSDLEHPCQTLADLLTIQEIKGQLKGLKVAFVGDGNNNVTHSLALAAGILGFELCIAAPRLYAASPAIIAQAKTYEAESGGNITETIDPACAVAGADVVYTDTWVSMGREAEKAERQKIFAPYQVTTRLMQAAKPDAIFMHDLPACRGFEVTSEVIDGTQSVVYQQAENRLHAQKALILHLLNQL